MALFDSASCSSVEVKGAVALMSRLSECAAYKSLTGTATDSAALATIVLGPGLPPFDGEEWTRAELEQRHCWANIYAPPDGEATDWDGPAVRETYQSGQFAVMIHWKPTEFDLNAENGANDCFCYFWDLTAVLRLQLRQASHDSANECPRIRAVTRVDYGWASKARTAKEGAELSCGMLITWGDLEE